MRIAILSDIHDNLWNLATALEAIQKVDALVCCGDLCSPFVVDVLARFPKEIHVVFGNNDADLHRITAKTFQLPLFHLHGEFCEREFDGKRFAVNHFDYIAKPLAQSGKYNVVCFGHNHEYEIGQIDNCLLINPGPIMGAKFSRGKWEDVPPTFVIYDSITNSVETFEKGESGFTRRDTP